MTLTHKINIKATLTLVSGLHIGDSKDNVEIGGVDNPVVRRKDNNQPYIPGSSLKGKMRSLLELAMGANADSDFKGYSDKSLVIARLFGWFGGKINGKEEAGNPSRLLVRDAYLTEDKKDTQGNVTEKGWATKLYESDFTDMPYTEVKWENSIDRLKGVALNPRQTERIPAGAQFEVNFVINLFESEKNEHFVDLLKAGFRLLEADYLGGSGSRGYGQVKIEVTEETKVDIAKEILKMEAHHA